jgi:hypothetical protein
VLILLVAYRFTVMVATSNRTGISREFKALPPRRSHE